MAQRLKITPIGASQTDYQRSPCYHAGCNIIPVNQVYQAEVHRADPTMSRFLIGTGEVRRMITDPAINPEAVYVNKNGKNTLSVFGCPAHISNVETFLETLGNTEENQCGLKSDSALRSETSQQTAEA